MNALETIIREVIAAQGAISVAAYMELALQHPRYGYYRAREAVGRAGDFITAPEVSQMFGEMIGVWCAENWRLLGKPDHFALVELGPGRGTMMRDIDRATAHISGFHAARHVYLIDSNALLRQRQSVLLADAAPRFIDSVSRLPALPSIIVANEFFDALPVRQFEKTFAGWAERVVVAGADGLGMSLCPLDASDQVIAPEWRDAALGTVVEVSPAAQAIMRDIARHLCAHRGAMLVVDYGYVAPSGAATLQAVSHHARADIFARPGEVDLTAHVDFTMLADVAGAAGATASPVVGQGAFLKNLGIDIRAALLKKQATPTQADAIDADLRRLIDDEQMGLLFKAMEVRCDVARLAACSI